jgi:hypothetical protein
LEEKGMMDEEERLFQRAPGLKYMYSSGYAALRLQAVEVMVIGWPQKLRQFNTHVEFTAG